MSKPFKSPGFQSGQTLIETIVAVFILTTALTSALGMAIFALNSSINAKNYVIAVNLAREGVDVARMMRDTNWLIEGAGAPPTACADLGNRPCYDRAYSVGGAGYDFNLPEHQPGSDPPAGVFLNTDRYMFVFNPVTRTWADPERRNGGENYFLCLQPASSPIAGTYVHNAIGVTCNNSNFARRVRIGTRSGVFGYSEDPGGDPDNQEVIVQSIVQWAGKGCPAINGNSITDTPAKCKVIVEERLTNWKDYR